MSFEDEYPECVLNLLLCEFMAYESLIVHFKVIVSVFKPR